MKNKYTFIIAAFLVCGIATGCEGFLVKPPFTSIEDEVFWVNESGVRAFAFEYYADRFPGFGNNDSGGSYSIRQDLNDDYTKPSLSGFSNSPTVEGGAWTKNLQDIRRDNIFINRLPRVTFRDQETADHWLGIARFFRAFDYARFVLAFGDVPYNDHELTETDPDLFRPRDPLTYVMDKVLEDYLFAANNVKITDATTGPNRQVITRDVVNAFMSRQLLMVGTTIKYNPASSDADKEKAAVYLQAAKDAAFRVISSGRFSLANSYQKLCSTVDIATTEDVKAEMILFRVYGTGMITHAIMTSNGLNAAQGTSATKDLIDSYLCANGRPISTTIGPNPTYGGDKTAAAQMANRDPRLAATFMTDKFYVQFENAAYASSGFRCYKFLDMPTSQDPTATQSFNVTDAPIIRLGEVMMNYIEACAELADMGIYTVVQNDLDITVNKLRKRTLYTVKLPDLQIIGGQPAVDGVIYDDAARDQTVPSFIWEIRRERRVELVYEGFRLQDLRRWRKINYANTSTYPAKNLGAWITKSGTTRSVVVADINGNVISSGDNSTGSGYIQVASNPRNSTSGYVLDRAYLESVPASEIDLYRRHGSTLTQNPDW